MAYGMQLGILTRQSVEEANRKTPPEVVFANPKVLDWGGGIGINIAGEAAKIIERKRPDLKASNPDFPWAPLKRLRDWFAHPSRWMLEGRDFDDYMKPVMKDYRRVIRVAETAGGFPKDEPLVSRMLYGIDFNLATNHLRRLFRNQPIPICNHPAVAATCAHYRIDADSFAKVVTNNFERSGLAGICDGFDHLSLMYPLDSKELRHMPRILGARNGSAHCTEMFIHDDIGERYVRDEFLIGEIKNLYPDLQNLLADLAKFMPKFNDAQHDQKLTELLEKHHYQKIVEDIATEPEKIALLERAIDFSKTLSILSARQKDGYVMVSRHLLSKAPVSLAAQIFDYLESKPKSLRTQALRDEMASQAPQPIRQATLQFMRNLNQAFRMPGENLGMPASIAARAS